MKFREQTKDLFKKFLAEYDEEKKDQIWEAQSQTFRSFWQQRVVNGSKELQDSEIDAIVRILDRNGKGNTKGAESVAKVMNPQGVWRRQFREIQSDKHLQGILNDIFESPKFVETGTLMKEIFTIKDSKYDLENIFRYPTLTSKAKLIDELYHYNKNKKNGLTGGSGNVLNSMMFAFNPTEHLSVISLNDRLKVISYFGFHELTGQDKVPTGKNVAAPYNPITEALTPLGLTNSPVGIQDSTVFDSSSIGKWMVATNTSIIEGFKAAGFNHSPRTLSCFLYSPVMQGTWKEQPKKPEKGSKASGAIIGEEEAEEILNDEQNRFGMENELEDFLITNWERTELGKKYDLFEENGNIGQQFQTDIGRIDILAVDKKTKQLVAIELKRGKSSDDTVGQLTRYMGWLKVHKSKEKPVKGIIIALEYDEKLHYALQMVPDAEVFTYKVNFSLEAHRKQ